jgi:hypothetical protein
MSPSSPRGCRWTIARCSPNGSLPTSAALLGFVLGSIAWWQSSHPGFLIGAIAMIAPWPWTLIGIKPVNDALLATEPDKAGPQARALVIKWGALHGVRTILGALATTAFLWACAAR